MNSGCKVVVFDDFFGYVVRLLNNLLWLYLI